MQTFTQFLESKTTKDHVLNHFKTLKNIMGKYNSDNKEWQIKPRGSKDEKDTYFTDDHQDAIDTASDMEKRRTNEEVNQIDPNIEQQIRNDVEQMGFELLTVMSANSIVDGTHPNAPRFAARFRTGRGIATSYYIVTRDGKVSLDSPPPQAKYYKSPRY